MHIRMAREVVNRHNMKLQEELRRRMEKENDGDIYNVIQQDPFFAGQIYAMAMLLLELNAIELDEEKANDLREAQKI